MRDNLITKQVDGSVVWLTINRPENLNALNAELLKALRDSFREFHGDSEARAIVLTGAGEKAFVAGADIKSMQKMDFAAARQFAALGHDCMNAIEATPCPVIAMVNGFALGGGLETALACDFIYAAEEAVFGLPEVTIGLFPGFGGTQRLMRLVGKARAMELIFSGRKFTASEGREWGVVNEVAPLAALRERVAKLTNRIAANAPVAIAQAKRVMLAGCDNGLTVGLKGEQDAFPACFMTRDRAEGLTAFVEKRRPVFVGK